MRWLAVIVLGGAVLRVVGLDGQSFWRDEASTVLGLSGGLGDAWDWVVDQEAQPPLYYGLASLWSQLFGLGEVGLRSLSVLFGTATIGVAYAIGREHAHRTGLIAAALVAANPWLVWYSQEARSYALLILLTALATLALLRDRPRLWALASAAALATHYFSAFFLIPQALIILRRRGRRAFPVLALPTVVGLALLPLLAGQADGRIEGIERGSLVDRLADTAKHWIAGPFGTPVDALGLVALVLVAAGIALGARWLLLLVPATAAIVLPALVTPGNFSDRYVVAALVPLLAVAATGLGRPAAAALTALFAAFTITIAANERLHREDWRAVADGLGPAAVVIGADGERALRVYSPGTSALTRDSAERVVLVASWRFGRERPADPALPGLVQIGREEGPTTTVLTYEAPEPVPIDRDALALGWRVDNQPPVLLDVP